MASNIIHYAISSLVLNEISVEDRELFLLGAAIGPDASSHDDGSYDTSHFWEWTKDDKKGINWLNFAKEYEDKIFENDFILGYFCHLCQDAVWFHDIVDVNVRCFEGEERRAAYKKGYRDYDRLNYLLREKYKLSAPHRIEFELSIKEITKEKYEDILNTLENCFLTSSSSPEELEMYTLEIIIPYIEKSAKICISEIKALKEGKCGITPESLFVRA